MKEKDNKQYKKTRLDFECMNCGEKFSYTTEVCDKEIKELEKCTPSWVLDCENCNTNEWVEMVNYKILEEENKL